MFVFTFSNVIGMVITSLLLGFVLGGFLTLKYVGAKLSDSDGIYNLFDLLESIDAIRFKEECEED